MTPGRANGLRLSRFGPPLPGTRNRGEFKSFLDILGG
jgi:hypothetical protein